jgi:hypothetical protein
MKIATLSASFTRAPPENAWTWLCSVEATSSERSITDCHDCIGDARKHGDHAVITRAHGAMAPGDSASPGRE